MSTTKAGKDAVPVRPDRSRVTQDGSAEPHLEPFADQVRAILDALGEDPDREGLIKTPERVESSLRFLTQGYRMTVEEVIGDAVFEEQHQSMILVRDIELYSLCEHHLLPFFGRAHVGYLPRGRIIGLSKIPRVVDMYAHRLQVQERLTQQVAGFLMERLNPKGVACVVEATHLCTVMRGVRKQEATMVTSSMLGTFRADARTRSEFLTFIGRTAER
jgi:GTP cyclohydrolase I